MLFCERKQVQKRLLGQCPSERKLASRFYMPLKYRLFQKKNDIIIDSSIPPVVVVVVVVATKPLVVDGLCKGG